MGGQGGGQVGGQGEVKGDTPIHPCHHAVAQRKNTGANQDI